MNEHGMRRLIDNMLANEKGILIDTRNEQTGNCNHKKYSNLLRRIMRNGEYTLKVNTQLDGVEIALSYLTSRRTIIKEKRIVQESRGGKKIITHPIYRKVMREKIDDRTAAELSRIIEVEEKHQVDNSKSMVKNQSSAQYASFKAKMLMSEIITVLEGKRIKYLQRQLNMCTKKEEECIIWVEITGIFRQANMYR